MKSISTEPASGITHSAKALPSRQKEHHCALLLTHCDDVAAERIVIRIDAARQQRLAKLFGADRLPLDSQAFSELFPAGDDLNVAFQLPRGSNGLPAKCRSIAFPPYSPLSLPPLARSIGSDRLRLRGFQTGEQSHCIVYRPRGSAGIADG